MDSVSRVEVFIEVAKRQSFIAAGRELGMTGPAISKQVQALEAQLGVRLLNRTTRHVSVTEEGAVYFERARKAMEDLREAEQQLLELKECPTGKLKINAPMSFGAQYLAEPIAEFALRYPDVELEVDFDDRWVDVIGEGFDVVIRIAALEDSSLIARKLAPCPIILCASASYIEQHGKPEGIESLQDLPAIIYNKHGQTEDWRYRGPSGDVGAIRLSGRFSGNSAEMQLAACRQGLGMALLPAFAVWPYLKSGELVQVLPQYQTYPERNIYAMFPQNRHVSTRVRLFLDFLSELGAQFPWAKA